MEIALPSQKIFDGLNSRAKNLTPINQDNTTIQIRDLDLENIEALFRKSAERYQINHGENGSSVQWFKDLSKIIFSRESTYRGLLEIFTDDLPAVVVEAFRGKAAFFESFVRHGLSAALMFITPAVSKFFANFHAEKIFGPYLKREVDNLMLFEREDLASNQKFDLARKDIVNDKIIDDLALLELDGARNLNAAIGKSKDLVTFMKGYSAEDEFRDKVLRLKDSVIKSQTWFEGITWGLLPFVTRLFRKYALGLDRFVGSVNYLSDKDADKLGNEKGFSFKQVLGTILSTVSSPLMVGYCLDRLKINHIQPGSFLDRIKGHLDMKHGFYPKLGLFMFQGEFPYLISRIFNSQDGFELIENLIKTLVNNFSTFFGDRFTNGNFARAFDKDLADEFGEAEGILYYKNDKPKTSWLEKILPPEATKFTDLINRTSHNPKLKEKATSLYEKIFYKGFTWHAISMFVVRLLINWTTRWRVKSALGHA